MSLGEILRSARKKSRLTMEQVGQMTGITVVSLHRYETDQRLPSFKIMCKIAKVLDIDLNSLISILLDDIGESGDNTQIVPGDKVKLRDDRCNGIVNLIYQNHEGNSFASVKFNNGATLIHPITELERADADVVETLPIGAKVELIATGEKGTVTSTHTDGIGRTSAEVLFAGGKYVCYPISSLRKC